MKKLTQLLKENYGDDILKSLSSDHQAAKTDILDCIKKTNGDSDTDALKESLLKITENGIEDYSLEGLVNENDIYDFYLKHESDIDDVLNNSDYFSKPPKELDVYSVYKYVIVSTQQAVKLLAEEIQNDLKLA